LPVTIALAGSTGHLGRFIAAALLERGAAVRALVRRGTAPEKLSPLTGTAIVAVDLADAAALRNALAGADVVVSALNGLRDAMIASERAAHPEAENETFPRFQQLQYTHNMQSGRGKLTSLDNARYRIRTTRVHDLLAAQLSKAEEGNP
jgi:putative NADH-flavin reductase